MSGQLVHLGGGEQPAGNLAADHLDAGLALAVDAVFQAEGAEVFFGDFAGEEGGGFGAEGFDLLADEAVMYGLEVVAEG